MSSRLVQRMQKTVFNYKFECKKYNPFDIDSRYIIVSNNRLIQLVQYYILCNSVSRTINF